MQVFTTKKELTTFISDQKMQHKSIGLVPTMGALHEGHLSLINRAAADNDVVVCSVFVNPVQFNNQEDLVKYPRTLEADVQLLTSTKCAVVFAPSVDEMYPEPPTEVYDFDGLDCVMEGAFRAGHFNGVGIVVKRLFDLVQPTRAYFGKKDYQQLLLIQKMVEKHHLPIEIVPCPIVREKDGLAMSSRNRRLSEQERQIAPKIHAILEKSKDFAKNHTPKQTEDWVTAEIEKISEFKIEYFQILDGIKLTEVSSFSPTQKAVGFIALWLGNIRLIDNVEFC
ncbi:MAG: pantoate--beta-alanine ligase [Bacteroidales bacterium]|nr:pantoate--beta-alanine ligase [Bacteroidales bacterium]